MFASLSTQKKRLIIGAVAVVGAVDAVWLYNYTQRNKQQAQQQNEKQTSNQTPSRQ